MRKYLRGNAVRTLLLSALLVASLSCSTLFYSANASGEQSAVSSSDAVADGSSEIDGTEIADGQSDDSQTDETRTDETQTTEQETDRSERKIEVVGTEEGGKESLFKKNAVYKGSFRSELLDDEQLFYDAFYTQCITNRSNETVTVDFTGRGYVTDDYAYIRDMVRSAFFAFSYDHPEVFWISTFSVSAWRVENDIVRVEVDLIEPYPDAFNDIDTVYEGINSAVNEISSSRNSASRYDTAKAIHDYICDHVSYDYDAIEGGAYAGEHAEDQTVAPLFGGGRRGNKFVCEGYSESFKLLCDRFNIPCVHVVSCSHAWDYVQMEDGRWYAVDVTWDDGTSTVYSYFLIGSNTVGFTGKPFREDHPETYYYFESETIEPFAYPLLSGEKYVRFDFWGECAANSREISGKTQFWWKYNSLVPSHCDVNVSVDNTHLATVEIDENGFFSYWLDTTELTNGEHVLKAVYRGTDGTEITVSRTVRVNNTASDPSFGFWDWHGDNPTVSGDFLVWMKQQNYGDPSNCDVNISIDGNHCCTVYSDVNGYFSYVIDTFRLNNGDHLLTAVFRNTAGVEIEAQKYFHVENPLFEIWDWTEEDRTVSGTFKVWMKQYNCGSPSDHDVNVFVDGVHRQTLYCDDDGFFSYEMNTTQLKNGVHTFKAILRTKSGFEQTDVRSFTVQNEIMPTSVLLNTTDETVLEGKRFSLTATVQPENATEKTVTWTSSDTTIATVTSDGTVTGITAGTAVVTASVGSVSASCTLNVQTKPVSYPVKLSRSTLSLVISDDVHHPYAVLTAKKPSSIKKIVWCSDNPTIASVSQSGKVTGNEWGTANIYCKSVTGEILSEPCAVNVRAFFIDTSDFHGTERFTIYSKVRCLPYTDSGTLDFIDTADSSASVSWKSSNTGIITIDKDGYFRTRGKKGTVTITATRGKAKSSINLRAYQPTQSLRLNYSNIGVYVGSKATLKAIQSKGADEPVFWESLDPSVVSVSSKGTIKGLSQGTAKIRAYTPSGLEAEVTVLVRTKAKGLVWSTIPNGMKPRSAVKCGIEVGSTKDLYVTITAPENCNDSVKWTTSNKSVVRIESSFNEGKGIRIKGLKKGTANITAKTGSGKKVTYQVSVVPQAAEQIVLKRNTVSVYAGSSVSLSAKVLPNGCNDVVLWKTSDPSVVTVDENGKATAVSQGDAVITAYSSFSGIVYDKADIHVRTKAKVFQWDTVPYGMNPGSTVKFAIGVNSEKDLAVKIISPDNCNDTITWSSSNSKIVEICNVYDANDIVRIHAHKKGTATVTAKTGSGKKRTYQIKVVDQGGQDILLNKHTANVYKGSSLSLTAKVTSSGNVVLWRSSDPNIARVDENGKVTAVSNGTVTITAYFSYLPGRFDRAEITVITRASSLSVNSSSVSLGVGESYSAAATMAPAGCNDKLTWSSSNKAIATVESAGDGTAEIKAVKPGKCTVTVKTGSGKKKSISIVVHS